MSKLDLEKAEEPEIKLPTSIGSLKNQENSRKTSTSALLTTPKPLTMWITTNCAKFLKKWEYQTTLPASWEICMQVKKQQSELDMKQCTGYIMQNAGLDEAQARIKIARKNINNLRHADDTTLMAESEEELESLLIKVKKESEKVDLKLNSQKMKIMASSPITSWQIDGETMETVTNFIFLGPKSLQMVTAAMKLKDADSLEENIWPT